MAQGGKKDIAFIDSIGQGGVWSRTRALQLGLVDRLGGLNDAIASAARLAKISEYRLREYPEPYNLLQRLMGGYQEEARQGALKEELGEDGIKTWNTIKNVKQMIGVQQARLPYDLSIE